LRPVLNIITISDSSKSIYTIVYIFDAYCIHYYTKIQIFIYLYDIICFMDPLLHVKIDSKLKNKMQELIDSGLFNNQVEIVREGLRDILHRYSNKK